MAMDMGLKNDFRKERLFFLLLILVIWAVVTSFVLYQYSVEKRYKASQLDFSLQMLNTRVFEALSDSIPPQIIYNADKTTYPGLRLSLIRTDGTVIYDSYEGDNVGSMKNHLTRPEIAQAIKTGNGFTLRRLSESTSKIYFYSALKEGHLIVRSALPYEAPLRKVLGAGHSFMWFLIAVTLLLGLAGFYMLYRMRQTAASLEKEHQQALFQEQEKIRIKKQLTNNINHELKTPVSAIKGCLETLVTNTGIDQKTRDDFLERSYRQTLRLESLLRDISTITRMDEVPEMIAKESLSLTGLITSVVAEVKEGGLDLPIRISCELPEGNPLTVNGNEQLLRSVFRNLIDNAIAYSGGRDIYIKYLGTKDSLHEFLFSDNGIGVEEEHLPHLFERFYRVDKGRSRKMGGTGLGLSIVKNAILLHGGTIQVSNAKDGGLEFRFTIHE
jgi:two-component system OmpR family sensor kinase